MVWKVRYLPVDDEVPDAYHIEVAEGPVPAEATLTPAQAYTPLFGGIVPETGEEVEVEMSAYLAESSGPVEGIVE